MLAIINNISYPVLSHYAKQDGTVHLILQSDKISFDELKNGIQETEEILITDDEMNQTIASYVGYIRIGKFSATLTDDDYFQIEIVLEAENIAASVENAQKKITNNIQAIESLTQDFTAFKQEIKEQLASIQESITNIQTELDRIDVTIM